MPIPSRHTRQDIEIFSHNHMRPLRWSETAIRTTSCRISRFPSSKHNETILPATIEFIYLHDADNIFSSAPCLT